MESVYLWFSAILSYLQKSEKWINCFPLILRIKSSAQMCCDPTVCFKIRVIKSNFCFNSMISQPLHNFIIRFSQKELVGSYDNIELNQRYVRVARRSLPKDIVAKQRYQTGDGLKVAVTAAFETTTRPMLRNMSHRTWRRIIFDTQNIRMGMDLRATL